MSEGGHVLTLVWETPKGGALTSSQQGTVIFPETAESHLTQQQLPFMVAAVESAAVSVVAPTGPTHRRTLTCRVSRDT
jgi:hypothetical protein